MMVSMMPMGATFASAEDGEEVSSEVTQTEESAEPTESTEPEESEPDGEPEESGEPEDTTYDNSISGTLWLDMYDDIDNGIYAGDGTRQSEELPLEGYTVYLYAENDRSTAVQTTTTDENGRYEFTNIQPGSYVVGVATTKIGEIEYLLPFYYLDGTEGDNRFVATYDASADTYLYAYTAPTQIAEDTAVVGMDAGMRIPPGIDPMIANSYITQIVHGKLVDGLGNPLAYTQLYIVHNQQQASGPALYPLTLLTTDANGYFYFNSGSLTYSYNGLGSYGVHIFIAFPSSLGITSVTGSNVAVSASSNITAATGSPTVYNGALDNGLYFTVDGYSIFRFGLHDTVGGLTSSITFGTASNPCVFQIGQSYQLSENYYIAGTTTALQTATGKGFLGTSSTYTGAPPATITSGGSTYYYIGYRTGSTGTTYTTGNPSFTVSANTNVYYYYALLPAATTSAATNVTGISASLNGTHITRGISGTAYFQYSTSSTFATSTTVGSATATSSSATSKTQAITGLIPATTYYFRIVVTTAAGTTYGSTLNFTTSTPAATTTAATNVTGISASLNGTYNTQGYSGTVQFEYGTSSTLATYTTVNATTLTSSAATDRSYSLTGLVPGTTYYYRLVEIVNGTRYAGSIVSFTTTAPAATTTAATSVTGISASLNGTYNTQGYAGTVQFEYGTDSGLSSYTTVNATTLTSSSATSRTFSLTGLTPATTYYYRLVIVVGTTRYTGSIVNFTTSTPTAATSAADTVTSSSAVLNGAYNTQGYAGTVQFEYGTSSTLTTYTTVDNANVTVSTSTNKTYTLTGLTDTTTYYYRIVTVVNGVRYEGTIQSFTTPAPNYTVTKIFVDESGASFQANGTATVPIGTPIYNSGITTGPVSVTPDIYIYQGYKAGSYTAGDTLDGIDVVPTNMTLAGDTTIYFVYHKLDTTTISVTFSTDPMEFYVDGNTWPNVATGPYGSSNYYYSLTNASECAVQVGFKKMTVVTTDGLNFVADASSSLPGSHDISIDLNVATSAEIGTAVNAFTAGVSNIIPDTVYSTPVILGTLDGQYTHPISGPVSTDGHITIGGYFADYLTGAGKYPTLKFTFEYTLITS